MQKGKLVGIMAEKGISQRKLAKEIGISKNALNLKINGKSTFDTEEATRICDVLGIQDKETKSDIFLD